MMAEPEQVDAAAFIRDAPLPVVLEIVRRLPVRSAIRLRSVCKAWRDITSHPALLAVLHRLQPPEPLLCFSRLACPDRYIQLRDYCIEALDLRSDKPRTIARFTDNTYCEYSENPYGGGGPPTHDVAYYGEEEEDQLDYFKPWLMVHASLDGLLLISFVNNWYVCNPATRQWVALPELDYRDVIGLYEHVSSGEYRVLYHTGKDDEDEEASTCYYVLTVGSQEGRGIGCPISPAATADEGLDIGLDPASLSPPVQLRCNLHWPPQERQGYHILVFDTEAEVFNWMRPPLRDADMKLFEMEGKLGMSVSRRNKVTLDLWLLQDYRNEIWVLVHRIELPVAQMPDLHYDDWLASVVSPEGDVLVQCPDLVLHCDRNGNLLQKFWFPEGAPSVKHALKESLLTHAIFLAPKGEDACEPPFFRGL
ncbi:hypothetical protein ACP70R_012512 [Stipagrostis hirtigluma subsp. patula]